MTHEGSLLADRYRVDDLIARGGMADVYRAHDERLGRDIAIKVLREVEHEQRFLVEAQTLARLNHPNLVQLLDAGFEEDQAYLVLELLEQATLADVLARGPIDQGRTREIGIAVSSALTYIHERGIIHRDVKPSNLMVDSHGSVRLADFGIARLVGGASLTDHQQAIGTAPYLAPEQLQGDEITPAADVYSLGLVLVECLTGQRAYGGTSTESALARLTRDADIPANLPKPWRRLLAAMTAGDVEYRPSAKQVLRRLEGGEPTSGPTKATPA